MLDKSNETLNPFLRIGSKERTAFPGYEILMNSKFPIHDGFIDTILQSEKPIVFDIAEVCNWAKPPVFMKMSKAAGLAESLSKSFYHGDELLGIITFWSE